MGIDDVAVGVIAILAMALTVAVTLSVSSPGLATRYETAVLEDSRYAAKYAYAVEVGGRLLLVLYPHHNPRAVAEIVGGRVLATFKLWPGGYSCEMHVQGTVRFGPDPYSGLWCPTPWRVYSQVPAECRPAGVQSRGRVLILTLRCP